MCVPCSKGKVKRKKPEPLSPRVEAARNLLICVGIFGLGALLSLLTSVENGLYLMIPAVLGFLGQLGRLIAGK